MSKIFSYDDPQLDHDMTSTELHRRLEIVNRYKRPRVKEEGSLRLLELLNSIEASRVVLYVFLGWRGRSFISDHTRSLVLCSLRSPVPIAALGIDMGPVALVSAWDGHSDFFSLL